MREFNENILESLDDGLVVFDADERIVRWNRALEGFYGVEARRRGRPAARRRLRCAVRRGAARGARTSTPTARRSSGAAAGSQGRRPTSRDVLLVNATAVPLQNVAGDDAVVGTILLHRGHHRSGAARRAAADLREDGVDRPAGGRRRARSEHAADRHFELHADAARGRRSGRSATALLEKIERQTFRAAKIVNGLLNLSRPGTPANERIDVDLNAVDHRRVLAARASVRGRQHQGAPRAGADAGRRCRASSTSCSRCS